MSSGNFGEPKRSATIQRTVMISNDITHRHRSATLKEFETVEVLIIFPEVHHSESLFEAINVNVSHVGVILEVFSLESAFERTIKESLDLGSMLAIIVDEVNVGIRQLDLVNLNHYESLSLSDYSYILADSSEMSSGKMQNAFLIPWSEVFQSDDSSNPAFLYEFQLVSLG